MDLDSQGFNIVCTISSSGEIRQVELNLIPAFIQSHGHGTNKWLHSGSRLITKYLAGGCQEINVLDNWKL